MNPAVESALIAAAATLVGVGGTVTVAITAVRNARRTNQATIDAARADAQLAMDAAREAQFADRYSRALEQVGSADLLVRIGGIYALEGIALDSPRHHPTVMEILTAFIREHSSLPADGAKPTHWPLADVHAAVTVVGRRKAEHDIRHMDLTGANLTGADLIGANLIRARLGAANLAAANLARANLANADLTRADLSLAYLSFTDLSGALLSNANLTGANLGTANLTRAYLSGAIWPGNIPVPDEWKLDDAGRLTRGEQISGGA